jgi:hypothetical protein
MTKDVWKKGEEKAKMLVEYVKSIRLYYGHKDPNKNEQETTKKTAYGKEKG